MPRGWKTAPRIAALIALVAASIAAYIVDARLKRWPDDGYALSGLSLTVASNDWPGFWRDALRTNAGHDAVKALSRQIGDLERGVRLATGVRPTPTRWSFWLGDRVVFSYTNERWGACLRPGLMFHLVHRALSWLEPQSDHDNVENWGGLWTIWHDGYLLLENHLPSNADFTPFEGFAVIGDASNLSATNCTRPLAAHAALTRVTVSAQEGLPIRVELSRAEPVARQRLSWPSLRTPGAMDDAIMDCFVEDMDAYDFPSLKLLPLAEFFPDEIQSLAHVPLYETGFTLTGSHDAAHLALFELPSSAGELLPHLGASLFHRNGPWEAHPFQADRVRPPLWRHAFAWDDVTGFQLPMLGEDFTYGCAVQGEWAHIANPAARVSELLINTADLPLPAPACRASVRWDLLADAITAYLRQRQQLGLLPGDPRAFEVDYGCWTDALRALGKARLASVDDAPPEMFTLRGDLAVREETAP